MKKFITTLIVFGLFASPVWAGWNPKKAERAHDKQTVMNKEVAATIAAFKEKDPSLKLFFVKAHGYAVFPTVGKGGFFVGGAHGKGNVYEFGKLIGAASLTQVTVGLQIGGQAYSEIIFFKDKQALTAFKSGKLKFGAQVSAVAANAGAAANVDYSQGVAIFTMAKGGLMGEASLGGQHFSFRPIQ
jgi:lipid-binding SYLF domain-containing protein